MQIYIGRSRHKIQELEGEVRRLHKSQELLVDNILAVQEAETTYTGNAYKSYSDAVVEISNKYSGTADWGVVQVGNIVDLRAAFVIGQGIKVKAVNDDQQAEAELEFAKTFIEDAGLDHELAQDLAKEAEIEGKILIKIFPIAADQITVGQSVLPLKIGMRWVSWTTNKYKINVDADDYMKILSAEWQPQSKSKVVLAPENFVYKRFAGRLDVPNDTMPRVGKCLTHIENLDKALRDWRQINKLYAAPTPEIECLTAQQAQSIHEQIEKVNWKIGKFLAHTGTFSYKQPSSEGQKAIESEIITLLKLISGATGVPIHFLGAPELTTKYGAANEGLLELISMSTSKEREIWRGAYKELLAKAMKMWNSVSKKTPLDPDRIDVELPQITKEQWDRLTLTWLPLYNSNAISLPTLLRQVPGLDVKNELDEKEKRDASMLSVLEKENASLRFEKDAKGGADGEEDTDDNNE